MRKKIYDSIVIGAGSGGLNIASFMNSIGLSVLLIDKSDEHIGGDCLNTGGVPSKALIHIARMHAEAKKMQAFGVQCTGKVDLAQVMAQVRGAQDVIREHENAAYFRKKGMDVVLGTATFAGKRAVQVGDTVYHGKKIVIATGSRPRMLHIPGADTLAARGTLFTNETIFSCTTL